MPRKAKPPVDRTSAKQVGALLRGLRRTAGFRAVHQAAAHKDCPAAAQTIYAYERGGLVPSLRQFLDLVKFYGLKTPGAPPEIRHEAVSAIVAALQLPQYNVTEAMRLMAALQHAPVKEP